MPSFLAIAPAGGASRACHPPSGAFRPHNASTHRHLLSHAQRHAGRNRIRCNAQRHSEPGRRTLLLSVAGLAAVPLDLGDALQSEVQLWGQELRFYQRQLQVISQQLLHQDGEPIPVVADDVLLDTDLASQLLSVPLRALQQEGILPSFDNRKYSSDFKRLFNQEMPYFQRTKACGHCMPGESLEDRAWCDFLLYIQYKAINLQLPPPPALGSDQAAALYDMMHGPYTGYTPRPVVASPQEGLRRATGRLLLAYVKGRCEGAEQQALESTSPALDDVRLGVRAIFNFFERTGFVKSYGIAFFGASKAEERNHEVWEVGEPAYLKYWMESPATFRSSAALQAEDGYSPDFVFATLEAFFTQSGVAAGYFRRYPSVGASPPVLAEQCLVQPLQPLPPSDPDAEYLPFVLDPCPSGTGMGCF